MVFPSFGLPLASCCNVISNVFASQILLPLAACWAAGRMPAQDLGIGPQASNLTFYP